MNENKTSHEHLQTKGKSSDAVRKQAKNRPKSGYKVSEEFKGLAVIPARQLKGMKFAPNTLFDEVMPESNQAPTKLEKALPQFKGEVSEQEEVRPQSKGAFLKRKEVFPQSKKVVPVRKEMLPQSKGAFLIPIKTSPKSCVFGAVLLS